MVIVTKRLRPHQGMSEGDATPTQVGGPFADELEAEAWIQEQWKAVREAKTPRERWPIFTIAPLP